MKSSSARGAANPAFFQQRPNEIQQSISAAALLKKFQQARREGTMNISSCQPPLEAIPKQVFQLEAYLEEGEKFWEVEPLRSLDMSFNSISFIPEDVGNLVDCHTIKARSNKLSCLPRRLFTDCKLIRHLDFSMNSLAEIHEDIALLQDLKDFLVNNNKICILPASLFQVNTLRILDLSNNAIEQLPCVAPFSLLSLTSLNLSCNRLRSLPNDLMGLLNLEVFNVSSNQLQQLPRLDSLVNLKTLDASKNNLSSFPIISSSKLSQLILSFNRISKLDMPSLSRLVTLNEFLVHNNCISVLGEEIEFLKNLKILDISNNDLQDLPATLGWMNSLQIIKIEGNRIKSIRQALLLKPAHDLKVYLRTRGPSIVSYESSKAEYEGESAAAKAPVSKETLIYRVRDAYGGILDLSGLKLTEFSDELLDQVLSLPSASSITTVNLSNNLFAEVPPNLRAFEGVKSLLLTNNELEKGSLSLDWVEGSPLQSSLTLLDISGNKLSALRSIQLISPFRGNLREISACNNPLVTFPAAINLCSNLRTLKLSSCSLRDTSRLDFAQVRLLEIIDFSNNKIEALPDSLSRADMLHTLNLDNNELRDIPTVLGVLPNMRTLNINGNPQRQIRSSVVAQGSSKVLENLRAKHGGSLEAAIGSLNSNSGFKGAGTIGDDLRPPPPLPPQGYLSARVRMEADDNLSYARSASSQSLVANRARQRAGALQQLNSQKLGLAGSHGNMSR